MAYKNEKKNLCRLKLITEIMSGLFEHGKPQFSMFCPYNKKASSQQCKTFRLAQLVNYARLQTLFGNVGGAILQ